MGARQSVFEQLLGRCQSLVAAPGGKRFRFRNRLLSLDASGEVGKQIDFLAQEMNREANTLLSKTTPLGEAGLPLTDAGLRIKAEVEKIREQAQNLE